MGVRITSDEGKTAIFDSVSGTAFGPVFEDAHEAEDYIEWLNPTDARDLTATELHDSVKEFRDEREREEEDE